MLTLRKVIKPVESKVIVDAIAKLAKEKWGEDWFVEFVRQYCEVEGNVTGSKPTAKNRRSNLERIFADGKVTLETCIWMAAVVDATLNLEVHEIRVVRF